MVKDANMMVTFAAQDSFCVEWVPGILSSPILLVARS